MKYEAKIMFMATQNKPLQACSCQYCDNEWRRAMVDLGTDPWDLPSSFMIVCRDCGNKRCPKATYHGHECTHSNDTGQPLSVYGGFKLDTSWNGLDDNWLDRLGDDVARIRAERKVNG